MSTTPVRRRPPRPEVRRALLDAAARVFARHGIDAASLDDVAADAGFTKGAVYSNFGSKAGLVAALVDDRTSAYVDLGVEAVSDPSVPLAEQARALGDRLTTAAGEQQEWQLLFLELWQRAVRTQQLTGQRDEVFRAKRQQLHDVVTALMAEHLEAAGVRPALSPRDLATVLMAMTNGLAIERGLDADAVPDDLLGRVLAMVVGASEG